MSRRVWNIILSMKKIPSWARKHKEKVIETSFCPQYSTQQCAGNIYGGWRTVWRRWELHCQDFRVLMQSALYIWGQDSLVPIYIDVDDGVRLLKGGETRRKQKGKIRRTVQEIPCRCRGFLWENLTKNGDNSPLFLWMTIWKTASKNYAMYSPKLWYIMFT